MINFEWDHNKNKVNVVKHGVLFEEAVTVFGDEYSLIIPDPEHSDAVEDRFVIMWCSSKGQILVVCHCYRESDSLIRIISARKATKKERKQYEERRQ